MEPTNTEEVIVEETPQVTEELVTLPFSITNTRENLAIIAYDRGYSDKILRTDYTEDMPIEERFISNPVDPVTWLNEHIKDFLADVASKPFIEARRRAKQAEIEAEAEAVRQIARQSIS